MTRKEFSRYVTDNYDKLLRFVRSRIANRHDAEDVLQRALVKLLLVCDDIDAQTPAGFFFTALRTGIIDHWRRRGRRGPEGPLPDQVPDRRPPTLPGEGAGLCVYCHRQVRAVLARLTPRERLAFAAYWKARGDRVAALDGLGLSEAGKEERYKVYDGALYHAKKKLALALLSVRERLEEAGADRVWELVSEELGGGPGATL
jgi:RNA polymerase sigma factor (sigma-70 family)